MSSDATPEQIAAIKGFWDKNTHLLLSAGAGSGKTFTLIQSVSYGIRKGYAESDIFLITFTRKAAAEMRERLKKNGISTGFAGTIHSLAYKIIRESNPGKKYQIITNPETIFKQLIMEKFSRFSHIPPEYILRALDDVNAHSFLQEYQFHKEKNNALDFEDMVSLVAQMDSSLLKDYQNKIIFIDEYQDTSPDQVAMLKKLNPRKLFAVGDAKQSIYQFRGANLENFFRFNQEFPNSGRLKLTANFRSQKRIVSFANAFIKRSSSADKIRLVATKKKLEKPVIFHSNTSALQENIRMMLGNGTTRTASSTLPATILVRTNYLVKSIETRIREKKLENRFSVMTIHKAKGLEFDHVILFGVSPQFFPHPNGYPEEEDRIFYVAVTRAKEHLEMYAWPDENGKESRFLPVITRFARNQYLSHTTDKKGK